MDIYGIGQATGKKLYEELKRKGVDVNAFFKAMSDNSHNYENARIFVDGLADIVGNIRFMEENR